MKQLFGAILHCYGRHPTTGDAQLSARVGIRRPMIAYVVAIGAAMVVQVLCALNWGNNFISDEAICALMALHMTQGHFTPYVYGGH